MPCDAVVKCFTGATAMDCSAGGPCISAKYRNCVFRGLVGRDSFIA